MKRIIAFSSVAFGCALSPTSISAAAATDGCTAQAQAVLTALDAGKYEDARIDFDQKMRDGLKAEQLSAIWESLPKQVGKRLAVGPARRTEGQQGPSVVLPLQYEKAWLEMQVSCDGDGQLNGLWIRPGAAPAAEEQAVETSDLWTEREIVVASGQFKLPGTLTLPSRDKAIAGVVLVHGSGSHDRDESIGPNKPFRDLAHGLAQHQIAVLRYDKRSRVDPSSFAGKTFTVKEEVIDDAAAALTLLQQQPELAGLPIFVAGHSLGAMLAPRIAAEEPVAGMILLAAPARRLTEIIPEQMNYIAKLDGGVSTEEQTGIAQMQALIDQIDALKPADAGDLSLLVGAPAAYWLDLRDYRPISAAAKLKLPILSLQGESDYQVTLGDDYQRWADAFKDHPQWTGQSFAGLNHLFMSAGKPPGPADYERAGHVDAGVIKAIGDWVKRNSAAGQ